MKALTISVDGTIGRVDLDANTDARLHQLQTAVDGHIEFLDLTENITMILNDEGKFEDPIRVNPLATALTVAYEVGLLPGDFIAGDVVLGGMDPEGELTDVPADVDELLELLVPKKE